MSEVFELTHFGVKGMKWGVRKAKSAGPSISKDTYKSVKKDQKEQRRLQKSSYKGVMADRKALKEKMTNSIKNDPQYAAAVKKLNKQQQDRAMAATIAAVVGSVFVPALLSMPTERSLVRDVQWSMYKKKAQRYAKRNSMFGDGWDGLTVPGEVIEIGMGLARRNGYI